MPTSERTTSRRTAGLGLLAYGIATPVAFIGIGSPGGDYNDGAVAGFLSSGHWVTIFVLAYVGAFASLGLLVSARRLRQEVGTAGDLLSGLLVAATSIAVLSWFMVGGLAMAMAQGGSALTTVSHPVVYLVVSVSHVVAVCASAFLTGVAALVLGAKSALPAPLRVFSYIAGMCGILAPVFFPLFVFWLWAIIAGAWLAASRSGSTEPAAREVQPV